MRSRIAAAACVFAFFCTLMVASAQEKGSAKVAGSPEEAVKLSFEAMKAGDLDAALATFPKGHGDAMRKLISDMEAARGAMKELSDAMKAKFGDGQGVPNLPDVREQLKAEGQKLVSYTITKTEKKDDGKVTVTVKTVKKSGDGETSEEKSATAIKELDGWKLLPPGMPEDPKVLEGQLGQIGKLAGAAKKVAKEINDGTLKNKADAQAAFGKALIGG